MSLPKVPLVLPDGKTYNLPYVVYSQGRYLLPDLPGLYFYLNQEDNKVRYVGVASRLCNRATEPHWHGSKKGYWEGKIAFLAFSTKHREHRIKRNKSRFTVASRELQFLEALCINWFTPDLNTSKQGSCRSLNKWAKEFPDLAAQFNHNNLVLLKRTA